MRLRFFLSTVIAASTSIGFCASLDFVGSSGSLSVDRTTAIPGDTLKAGSYMVSVTEQLADRMIVRIDSTTSKNHAIFLAVPSSATKLGGATGAVAWGVGVNKTQTMRGFVFPNGNAVEFVYPKAEAAALAKDNRAIVIALDPRSEGKVALKSLSQDELAIVNLWLLSMTTTGVDSKTPAVLAKHYDGPQSVLPPVVAGGIQPVYPISPGPAPAPAAPIQRAVIVPAPVAVQKAPAAKTPTGRKGAPVEAKAAPVVAKTEPVLPKAKTASKQGAVASSQVASLEEPGMPKVASGSIRQNRGITQLPHTASSLPMFWTLGLMSLLGAGLIRIRRTLMNGWA